MSVERIRDRDFALENARRRVLHLQQDQCTACTAPRVPGKRFCVTCAEKAKARSAARPRQGRPCGLCGEPGHTRPRCRSPLVPIAAAMLEPSTAPTVETLAQALRAFLAGADCAEATKLAHRDFAVYLLRYFGDRSLADFAGAPGGELVATYLRDETIGRDRGLRERFGGPGNLKRALAYTSVRQRLNTLRLALEAAVAGGHLASMPDPWPVPRPGVNGHLARRRPLIEPEPPAPKPLRLPPTERAPGADQPPPEGATTITQAFAHALAATSKKRRQATMKLYRESMRYLVAYFGDRPVKDFEGPAGYRLLFGYVQAESARGLLFVTLKKRLIPMRLALREAARRGEISGLPIWPDFVADGQARTRYLTPDEYRQLREAMPEQYRTWIDLAVWTGQHTSDLRSMTWMMTDLGAGPGRGPGPGPARWMRRNTKNGKAPQWLPMPDELRRHLTVEWRLARPEPTQTVLAQVDNSRFRTILKRACWKAGIERVALIDCRRTCATWLLENGAPKDAIRAWLGHATTSQMIERHYAQVTPTLHKDLVAALNRVGALDTTAAQLSPVRPAGPGADDDGEPTR